MEIPKSQIKEVITNALLLYLKEDDNLEQRQVQIEEAIGKKLIEFCKSKGINLAQITVNWNPSDKVNSYLIRLFVDNNEKYVGLLFDNGLNISNSVNLQENFFTIGDEIDKMFFRLINLIVSDAEFIKALIETIRNAIKNADNPEMETSTIEDAEKVSTSEGPDDEEVPSEDDLNL